jgi:anti-sigma factor RsiW
MAEALTCRTARALVSAYMNQDLHDEQAQAVEAHVRGCPTCPTLYAGLLAVQRRLRSTPRPSLSLEERARMARRLSERLGTERE